MKAYKNSKFDFKSFENLAPKDRKLFESYKQVEKFFVAKGQGGLFGEFLEGLR